MLILGNSGMGKSYLMKLIIENLMLTGKSGLILDPESEYVDLVENLGGVHIDLMSGEYIINVLEPKVFGEELDEVEEGKTKPKKSTLSTHISFLREFFKNYKDFKDNEIDVIEIMLQKLYKKFNISDDTNLHSLPKELYPILSDLYILIEEEYEEMNIDGVSRIYSRETVSAILLGLNSMCVGSESKIFNGYTNVIDDRLVCFGVKDLLNASKNIKNALMFNLLSYMSDKLLTKGNTFASIDELYLFLGNITMVEYIRNYMKRVRKKESAIILATQNVEDFNLPHIREFTKPLFAIPTYKFVFNCGDTSPKLIMDLLQIEENEFDIIKHPVKGQCLFKAGAETFNLQVKAPKYKAELFGDAGGR